MIYCDTCNTRIHVFNYQMVMLKDNLWLSIAKEEETLCISCIEKRLHRKIQCYDLKYFESGKKIPVNMIFAEKHNLNY